MLLKLSNKEVQRAFGLKPVYFKAQSLTGVPWQLLAAIHYRERSQSTTASNPYQFDKVLTDTSSTRRRFLYSKYSTLTQTQTNEYIAAGINSFEAATVLAACFVKDKRANLHYPSDFTDETIKLLLWAYNGRAYGGPDRSPYVMNGYDENHRDMIIQGTVDGKPIPPTIDRRPGAFVVYRQLVQIENEQRAKLEEA